MPRTKKKVKSIVKTKVISARVTETVHELLHRQAEDAGMTLSEFAAQMLMKGRVNTSYSKAAYREKSSFPACEEGHRSFADCHEYCRRSRRCDVLITECGRNFY